IALEREVEGDLMLADMGQDEGFRPGVIDGAINISAVQWLCNADKTSHDPRLRLKAFFGSLYRCLTRGARAVLQVYPEKLAQRELILGFAMRSGFAGGVFVHNPHSTKKRKEYLVLNCGPPSLSAATPQGKREQEESCSDDEGSGDKENQTVCISGRQRPRKKQKITKWVMKKKEQMRRREIDLGTSGFYLGLSDLCMVNIQLQLSSTTKIKAGNVVTGLVDLGVLLDDYLNSSNFICSIYFYGMELLASQSLISSE
ncbi:unnamed protein product, partial [Ilex paraguariensis]